MEHQTERITAMIKTAACSKSDFLVKTIKPLLSGLVENHGSHLISRYYGNKHQRLVEPLCGGLAVTLGLMPEKVSLNDINYHVIKFYK